MLKLSQRSKDELFSIALYNWLIQADLADKLLQVKRWFFIAILLFYISNIISFPGGQSGPLCYFSSYSSPDWDSLYCGVGVTGL